MIQITLFTYRANVTRFFVCLPILLAVQISLTVLGCLCCGDMESHAVLQNQMVRRGGTLYTHTSERYLVSPCFVGQVLSFVRIHQPCVLGLDTKSNLAGSCDAVSPLLAVTLYVLKRVVSHNIYYDVTLE